MITVKKFLKLMSCETESDLDKIISTISEEDAKAFIKMTVKFMKSQNVNVNDIRDYSSETIKN